MADIFRRDDPKGTSETLIEISEATNLLFFQLARGGLMEYRDNWPSGETEWNIRRVRKRAETKFARLVKDFPYDWPLAEQGAYILRAYSGLQIFPDANHRTGLVISRQHLFQKRHELRATTAEVTALVDAIRSPKSLLNARCTKDKLLDRNPCFTHIASFYAGHLHPISLAARIRYFASRVAGREVGFSAEPFLAWEDPAEEAARKAALHREDPPGTP